ncbi:uncharacterized protein LOC132735196 [Ruditapes philippinarum]|uniref:uncharacterized protein LOC132735196 n=1 Tax=Ruditapes philippinarum TaxID=129788 RepID=UPI00295B206B|nr:uncharacterized protein LOC132735196 [Ruditapes philippinarum]
MALYRFNVVVVVLYLAIFQDVGCDYSCICNYNVELAVFGSATETGNTIGYLYEFDCKPHVLVDKLNNKWLAVAFENQLGFIQKDAQILIQTCPGQQPDEDKLTTTPHTTILKPTSTLSTSTSFLSSYDLYWRYSKTSRYFCFNFKRTYSLVFITTEDTHFFTKFFKYNQDTPYNAAL